jgi:hypothetical protein
VIRVVGMHHERVAIEVPDFERPKIHIVPTGIQSSEDGQDIFGREVLRVDVDVVLSGWVTGWERAGLGYERIVIVRVVEYGEDESCHDGTLCVKIVFYHPLGEHANDIWDPFVQVEEHPSDDLDMGYGDGTRSCGWGKF